jgi:hypothetical protein
MDCHGDQPVTVAFAAGAAILGIAILERGPALGWG